MTFFKRDCEAKNFAIKEGALEDQLFGVCEDTTVLVVDIGDDKYSGRTNTSPSLALVIFSFLLGILIYVIYLVYERRNNSARVKDNAAETDPEIESKPKRNVVN